MHHLGDFITHLCLCLLQTSNLLGGRKGELLEDEQHPCIPTKTLAQFSLNRPHFDTFSVLSIVSSGASNPRLFLFPCFLLVIL